ncbi:hypothetical protein SCOCK_70240 [Actinacidiphila cocklensis]|uniref:Uncharacterized protein n=1 Tax=Actinacidiphila cocklensis TaxID=887465 RepID=A0A9W4DYM7_9ACTN|nr:hypothetical protein SCOCK_70240 [Actinacidiphila cocklensis]
MRAGRAPRLGIPLHEHSRSEKSHGSLSFTCLSGSMRSIPFNAPSLSPVRVTSGHFAAYLVPRRGPGARAYRDEGGDIHAPALTLSFRAPPGPQSTPVGRAGRRRDIGGAARDGGRLALPGHGSRRRRWRWHPAAARRGGPAEDGAERHQPRHHPGPALRHAQLGGVVRHFGHRRAGPRDHHRPGQRRPRRAGVRPRLAARAARLDARVVHRRQHLHGHRPGRRDHRRAGGQRRGDRHRHQRQRRPAAAGPGRHPLHRGRRLHADPLPGGLR